MTHYRNGHKHGNLGTNMACIPLLLAAYAAERHVVVELGPFLGFSSKCLAAGLAAQGPPRNNTFFVYDTFNGLRNFKAIQRLNKNWLPAAHPEYTADNNDYQFLWDYGVRYLYPTVTTHKGFVSGETLHPAALHNQQVGLISIDSAKSNKMLRDQLAGLGPLPAGAMVMMMDFEYVREHVILFFACLRDRYLMPVYVSWNLEHWLWIVKQDVDLVDQEHYTCYSEYTSSSSLEEKEAVVRKAEADLLFLSGLTDDPVVAEAFKWHRERLLGLVKSIIRMEKPK